MIARVLQLADSAAHATAGLVTSLIRLVVPAAQVPEGLAVAIGWLALLTVGLAVADMTRKLAWIAVGVAWALVVIRVAMVALRS